MFEVVRQQMHVYPESYEQAVLGNQALNRPFDISPQREPFWSDYREHGYEYVVEKYCYPEEIPEWLSRRREGIKARRKDYIRHIPNQIGMKLLGNSEYTKIKQIIKK